MTDRTASPEALSYEQAREELMIVLLPLRLHVAQVRPLA